MLIFVYVVTAVRNEGTGLPGKLSVDEIKRFCTRLDAVPCRIKEADIIRVCQIHLVYLDQNCFS